MNRSKLSLRIAVLATVVGGLCAVGNGRLWSAEDAAKPAATGADAAPAKDPQALAQATEFEKAGTVAMEESNGNPSRSVDAAIAFTSALKLYEAAGDSDKMREMHANIFWCKKRMDVNDLQKYLASKGHDAVLLATVEKMNQVADKAVPKEEADAYFKRAQDFAAKNPDKQFLIAIRYFEVAQRFQGTEVSLKAQRLSLDAQEAHMKTIQIGKEAKRDTLFSHSTTAAAGDRTSVPTAAEQKAALLAIKKLYKDDYANVSSKKSKKTLGWKLFEQAKATKDDAKIRYVLFSEAVNFAVGAEDIHGIISFIDEASRYYGDGYDPLVEKKAALTKIKRIEAAAAILKLFDNADDPVANLAVGKYYCLEANQWEIGLPLLAAGSDADYKKLAEMELEKPAGGPQQMELGDRWFDLGVKARSPLKEGDWARAHHWYKQCFPSLSGLSKERISQRLDDLFGLVPDSTIDYTNLTDKQWDKLKGTVFEVPATRTKSDTHVVLKPGQKARVVPSPTDTWTFNDYFGNGDKQVTYKGMENLRFGALTGGGDNNLPAMGLICWVVEAVKKPPGILEGPGDICLAPNDPYGLAHHGMIRVKIILLDDE